MVNGLEGGPLRPAIFFEKSDRYQHAGLDYPVQWSPTLETLAITNLLWLILDGPNQPLIWPWALINKLMSFSISYIRRRVCFCSMVYLDHNVVINYPKRSRLMQWYFRWIITEGLLRAISLIECPNVDTSLLTYTHHLHASPRAFQSRDWGRMSVQSEGGDDQRMARTEAFRHNLSAQVGRGNLTAMPVKGRGRYKCDCWGSCFNLGVHIYC